jgi:hypothetical protein
LGIKVLLINRIIPSSAIKELSKDNQNFIAAIKFSLNWKRPRTYYFPFTVQEDYDLFIEKITSFCSLKWQEKPIKLPRYRVSVDNIQLIIGESLAEQLPPKTLSILQKI